MDFKHGLPIGGTDAFVNKGEVYLEFFHIPTHAVVLFKAFVENFVDNYEVGFKQEKVYGRMDPIAIFEGTSRNIQLSWKMVAETEQEAYMNLQRAQKYAQMLYPSYNKFSYDGQFSVSTLSTPPLLKLRFMNLIGDASTQNLSRLKSDKSKFPTKGMLDESQKDLSRRVSFDFSSGNAQDAGLLVIPGNMTINHNLSEEGAILKGGGSGVVFPYVISMGGMYTVLHQHSLGSERGYRVKGNTRAIRRRQKELEKRQANLNTARSQTQKLGKSGRQIASGATTKIFEKQVSRAKERLRREKQKGSTITQTGGKRPKVRKDFEQFPYGAKEKVRK